MRPCSHPSCPALVTPPGRWCARHRPAARTAARALDRGRGTAAERGYGGAWQRAREGWLARWPVCPGILLPTPAWSPMRAMEFHDLRVREQQALRWLLDQPGPLLDFLAQYPIYTVRLCDVGHTGRAALEVDHIMPHRGDAELFWGEWNWQTLTQRAHAQKTSWEKRSLPSAP